MQSLNANFFILFYFSFTFFLLLLFSLFGFRISVRVMSGSYCHTSVTLDDMVTVTVTSHEVTKKNIEGSEKIMSYNVCKTHGHLG